MRFRNFVAVACAVAGTAGVSLGEKLRVLAVAASGDGSQVISSGYETQIYWWNAKTGVSEVIKMMVDADMRRVERE